MRTSYDVSRGAGLGNVRWCDSLAVQVAPPLIGGRQILNPLESKPEGAAADVDNPQVG